ncbi:hypothetical protein WJX82_002856 [Trebouxia sp. C0006]
MTQMMYGMLNELRPSRVTAEQVVAGHDLTGKTVVLTGGNSGIGTETARVLAAAGARVIMTSRDIEAGQQVAKQLMQHQLKGQILVAQLDLADLHSVAQLAQMLNAEAQIDTLICNAGVMACPLSYTKQGFERQIGTNHFGHFYLFRLLEAKLAAQNFDTRVVVVSSAGHATMDHWKGVNFADMHYKEGRTYGKLNAYGQSKSANILFAKQIAVRHPTSNLRAYSLHPGNCKTQLQRHLTLTERLAAKCAGPVMKTLPQAAATTIYAAVSPDLLDKSGAYLVNVAVKQPSSHCRDLETAQRLWEETSSQIQKALDNQTM